jgi:hypothetical protein
MDELQELAKIISDNEIEKKINKQILETGKVPTNEDRDMMRETFRKEFMKGGNRKFFKTLKDEIKDIPIDVFVNITGKQKNMLQNADKLSNLVANIIQNPGAIAQVPGVGKLYNELLEESGYSAIDFTQVTVAPKSVVSPIQPAQVASADKTLAVK